MNTMRVARIFLLFIALSLTTSCDKLIASKEAQRAMATTAASTAYLNLQSRADDATIEKAADIADALPASLGLDDRFRCMYETMVIADWTKRRAGKPTFSDTGRITDDNISAKAVADAVVLGDREIPADATEAFLQTHAAIYDVPSEENAVFAYAVWFASFIRAVSNKAGVATDESNTWLTKGRSRAPADMRYRRRAGLGVGERRCFDLLGIRLVAKKSFDAKSIASALERG